MKRKSNRPIKVYSVRGTEPTTTTKVVGVFRFRTPSVTVTGGVGGDESRPTTTTASGGRFGDPQPLNNNPNPETKMDKTNDNFEKLVRDMRAAQKKYFRTRDHAVLEESKRLEHDVDKYLEERNKGMDLFE